MILKVLSDYYDALADQGKIIPVGWSVARVSFGLCLGKFVFAPDRIEEKRRTDQKRDSTNTESHVKKLNFYTWRDCMPHQNKPINLNVNG